jgi:hypothetical protein
MVEPELREPKARLQESKLPIFLAGSPPVLAGCKKRGPASFPIGGKAAGP